MMWQRPLYVIALFAIFCIGLSSGACPANCVSCGQNSLDSCDGCVAGYVIVGPPLGQYCAGCSVGCTNGCTSKGAGKCDPCSTTGCTSCNSSYSFNTVNFTCDKCDPNCQGGCPTKGTGKCDQTCKTGYNLVNFQCVIVCDSNCVSGCTTSGPYNCDSQCKTNWLLLNNKCIQCDPNCLNILGCSTRGSGRCDAACKTGYSLFTGNYTCVASVNGGWTDWTAFTACAVDASGVWKQTRTRTCTNPAPSFGGLPCSGSATDTSVCPAVDGVWSDWSAFTACAADASGVWKQTRTRTCTPPVYGGLACSGSATDSTVCPAVDGVWSDWSAFSACADAGSNVWQQTRTRTCTPPVYGGQACSGSASDTVVCPAVDGVWSDWSAFSACADAGSNVWQQTRTRTCTPPVYGGQACSGSASDTAVCPAVDGVWSDWSAFTACANDGNNVWKQTRTRTCTPPVYGGLACPGSASDTAVCPAVDGGWTDWAAVAACADDGTGIFKQTQTRTCTNPAPVYGGTPCSGSASQVVICIRCSAHCTSNCTQQGNGKCDSSCDVGYGLSSTFTCAACQSTCAGTSTCNVRGPGTCDGPCVAGYGLTTNNLCAPCAVRCTSGCSVKGAGKCDSSCQTGFALSTTDYTCQPCDSMCISGCTVPYKCSSTCAAGYVLNSNSGTCLPCNANCIKTVGSCNVRGPNKCDSTCVGLYALTSSYTCQACNAQCAFKCTTNGPGYCDNCTTTGCASCKANYALKAVMVNNVRKLSCFPCAPLCTSGCVKEGPDCCDSTCQSSVSWVAKNATCHICGGPSKN